MTALEELNRLRKAMQIVEATDFMLIRLGINPFAATETLSNFTAEQWRIVSQAAGWEDLSELTRTLVLDVYLRRELKGLSLLQGAANG